MGKASELRNKYMKNKEMKDFRVQNILDYKLSSVKWAHWHAAWMAGRGVK